jgi:hypothetical protein
MSKLGSKENPIRILVADNWGAEANSFLINSFPNIKFSVYKKARSTHPHGHMVAECICHMIPYDAYAEIVFLPYLSKQNNPSYNWMNVIESERNAGRPFHIANCSFGQWHQNNDIWRTLLDSQWDTPEQLEIANKKIGDTIVLFAAGNQDTSTRKFADADNDINYPQKALDKLKNVFVIGACDKNGVPSLFSSDGKEVWAMYLGEGVLLYDPIKRRKTKVNGTSFASPFAAGDVACNMIKGENITEKWYLDYVLSNAWLAEGWVRGQQHRKAGYGCMLPVMMNNDYFKNHYINRNDINSIELEYEDFDEV